MATSLRMKGIPALHLLAILLVLVMGCSQPEEPTQADIRAGIDWAVGEQIRAGTQQTGYNTRFVPLSPGQCESFQIANHYTRKIDGEVYQCYAFHAKFQRQELTVRVSFVKRGNEWLYSQLN